MCVEIYAEFEPVTSNLRYMCNQLLTRQPQLAESHYVIIEMDKEGIIVEVYGYMHIILYVHVHVYGGSSHFLSDPILRATCTAVQCRVWKYVSTFSFRIYYLQECHIYGV